MSKRRAERVASTFSGGVLRQILPYPVWFSVAEFIFFWRLPFLIGAWFYFNRVLSESYNRLNYSLLVDWSKGADLQKEKPVLQNAEVIQNHIYLFYDRPLNIESLPSYSDFAIFVCGKERKISGIGYAETQRGFRDIVQLMLRTSVNAGEEVRIYYIPRKVPIEDLNGNSSQGLKNVLVGNLTK